MWGAIKGLVQEIKRCEEAGLTMATLALCYVCIDMLAYLSMPAGKVAQTRDDFITWVNLYLKGHPSQPYQYDGLDVYAARCAVLHSFGSEAQLHRNDAGIKLFGYHDGGKHNFEPAVNPRLVLIAMASFTNDVVIGVLDFMKACETDADLRGRAEARLPGVLTVFPIK